MLELAAAGSTLSLAGCNDSSSNPDDGGNGNTTTDGENNNGGGGQGKKVYKTYTDVNPMEVQFNRLSSHQGDWPLSSIQFAMTTRSSDTAGKAFGMLVKDWTIDGKTMTAKLNENFAWSDGRPLTANDVMFQFELEQYMASGDKNISDKFEYADGIEATGKYELTYDLNAELEPAFAADEVLGAFIWAHPPTFKKFHEQFQDASSDSAKQDAQNALNDFRWEEPIQPGPTTYVGRDQEKVILEINDHYPFKDVQKQFSDAIGEDITSFGKPDVDKIHFYHLTEENKILQEIKAGNVDGGSAIAALKRKNPPIPDNYGVVKFSTGFGRGLMFNFWSEDVAGEKAGLKWFKDVNVRQAITHVLDRKAIGHQMNPDPEAVYDDVITAMNKVKEEEYVSDGAMDSMIQYGDKEKAAELLKESGFTRKSGKWYTPDGDRFKIPWKTASNLDFYVKAVDVATSQLNEFGIATEFETQPGAQYFGADPAERGYQMTPGWSFGGAGPGPATAFSFMYRRPRTELGGGDGINYYLPGKTGDEETMEVPPIGEPDSDERMSINPHEYISKLARKGSKEEKQKLIDELAWASNWWMPKLPCVENTYAALVNPGKWKYPDLDSHAFGCRPTSQMIWQLGIVDSK